MINNMSELYYRLKVNAKSTSTTKNYFRVKAYTKQYPNSVSIENGIAFYYNEVRARIIETLNVRQSSRTIELQVMFTERDGYETIKELKFPVTIREISSVINKEVNLDVYRGRLNNG